MADGGKVIIKIDGDTKGLQKAANSAKKILTTSLKGVAVGAAAVTTATVGIGTAAVKAFAQYEQLVGGVETLFKDSAKQVQKYADVAYKTAGLSANKYMSTVTSFSASLLQSLGGDTKKAAEYANSAVIDMSDNANKMGTEIYMIQNAYQGFAKQNFTMLDNLKLGYGGTKEEMARLLADAQKLSGIKFDISSFADITEAIHVIQTEMGITGTTAKEATTTIQGSFSMLQGAWENLMVGITDPAQDIDRLLDDVFDSFTTVIENLLPRIENALPGIAKAFNELAPQAVKTISALFPKLVPEIVSGMGALGKAVYDSFPDVLQAFEDLVVQIAKEIRANKDDILPAILEIGDLILDAFLALVPELFDVGNELLDAVFGGMMERFPNIGAVITAASAALVAYKAVAIATTIAQNALNLSLTLNPIGLVVAGFSALAVALINAESAHKKEIRALNDESKALYDLNRQISTRKQNYEDLKKSQVEKTKADLAEIAKIETLSSELYNLVDENGNVLDKDRQRVNFIKNELNNALGTNIELVGDQIVGLQKLQTEIDNLIAKRKYQIFAESALTTYQAALTGKDSALSNLSTSYIEYEKLLKDYESALEAEEVAKEKFKNNNFTGAPDRLVTFFNTNLLRGQLLEAQENYEIAASEYEQYLRDIDSYNKAEMLAYEGKYDEAIDIFQTYNSEYKSQLREAQGNIEKQKNVLRSQFENTAVGYSYYAEMLTKGATGFTKEGLEDLRRQASNLYTEAQSYGEDFYDSFVNGVWNQEDTLFAKTGGLLFDILAQNDKVLDKIEENIVDKLDEDTKTEPVVGTYIDTKAENIEKELTAFEKALAFEAALAEANAVKILEIEEDKDDALLDSEKKYNAELERTKKKRYQEEWAERFAGAKDAAELEELKGEMIAEAQRDAEDEYLQSLSEAMEAERRLIEEEKEMILGDLEAMIEEAYDDIEEMERAQKDFAEKLKDFGELYTTETVTKRGKEQEATVLANLREQTQALKEYEFNLRQLKARGNVDNDFFEMLRGMSVEEGLAFSNALLYDTDKAAFDKYMADWDAKQAVAEKISQTLYEGEADSLASKILGELNNTPEDELTEDGKTWAEKFGSGFVEQFRAMVNSAMSEVSARLTGLYVGGGFAYAGLGTTTNRYSDNSVTNIYASGLSERELIEAKAQSDLYNKHTRGW